MILTKSKEIKCKTKVKFKCWTFRLYSRRHTLRGEGCCLKADVITVQRQFHSYIAVTAWHSVHTALYCAVPYCVDVTDCDTALYCAVPYCVDVTDCDIALHCAVPYCVHVTVRL